MLTFTAPALANLTGAALLALVARQPHRQGGDLQIKGTVWKVYKSTHRGRNKCINLWTPNGPHVQGLLTQRIAEMRPVERTEP